MPFFHVWNIVYIVRSQNQRKGKHSISNVVTKRFAYELCERRNYEYSDNGKCEKFNTYLIESLMYHSTNRQINFKSAGNGYSTCVLMDPYYHPMSVDAEIMVTNNLRSAEFFRATQLLLLVYLSPEKLPLTQSFHK